MHMTKSRVLLSITAVFWVSLVFVGNIAAQTDFVGVNSTNINFQTLRTITPSNYVRTIITFLLGGAGIASFAFLLIGGVRWITSAGDKEGTEKARKTVSNALLGLAFVFSVYVIFFIMRTLFNIDLIQAPIFRLGSTSTEVGTISTYGPGTSAASAGYICTGPECTAVTPSGGMCPCGGGGTGQCAADGTIASISYYGACYLCNNGLWEATGDTGCAPITCGACN
jgi:hypothetical protein